MKNFTGRAATPAEYDLAEGILWDDREQLVRWVDIRKGRLLSGRLDAGKIVGVSDLVLGQTTGAVALAEDGGLLVAAARGLATLSPRGEISIGPDLLGDRRNVRLNDGSVDPFGAFVVGSMALGEATGEEVLLRVQPHGEVETLRTGVRLSNGVAFSPSGDIIFHIDTESGTLSRHSYGPVFDRAEPWLTVIDDFPALPDGLTIAADGSLWVAQWGGHGVLRYSPDGRLLGRVSVDAAQSSCPGFVGPELRLLAVTTAQQGLESFSDQAGAIFLAEVDAQGLASPRWQGSTARPYWQN